MNEHDNITTAQPHYDADATMPNRRERINNGRFSVGDIIMNRYKILAELGQGGMGVVYKCFDDVAGIEVALKALPPELSHNTIEMEDIKDNFQLIHNLHHPNIASYNNLERDNANGNYYLIMECCEGEDLRRWIRRKRKEGALTLELIQPIISQIANALDYAHSEKIIHRDIKPGNVMISNSGKVKVLDFGLAAQIHTSMTRVSMAYYGTSGTGPYMAPEQWNGLAQDAKTDQYALAVLTYEMFAGRTPFESPDAAVLREAVLKSNVPALSQVSEQVNNTLLRALSKDSALRFANCSDFVKAMDEEINTPCNNAVSEKKETGQQNKKNGLFSGRVARAEFWLYQLRFWLITWLSTSLTWCIAANITNVWRANIISLAPITLCLLVAAPWNIAVAVRRLHDVGISGKFLYLLFLPVIGWCWVLNQLLKKSQEEQNEYGEKPQNNLRKWKSPVLIGCLAAIAVLFPWTRFPAVWLLAQHTGIIKTISIPYGFIQVPYEAFIGCSWLQSINIPDSVTTIGESAFIDCSSLQSINIPDSVTYIGPRAFWRCSSLQSINIPDSVTTIGESAFEGCSGLQSISAPDHLDLKESRIGYYAKKIIRRKTQDAK